ncbi:hypothetical protein D3C84_1243460 [compost metagenome]
MGDLLGLAEAARRYALADLFAQLGLIERQGAGITGQPLTVGEGVSQGVDGCAVRA